MVVLSEVAIVNSVNDSFLFGTKSLQFKKNSSCHSSRTFLYVLEKRHKGVSHHSIVFTADQTLYKRW